MSEDIEDLNNIEFYQEIILEDIIGDLDNKCDLENNSSCTNDEDNEEINIKNDYYVNKDNKDKENNGPDTSNAMINKIKSIENNNNDVEENNNNNKNNNTSGAVVGEIKNDNNYVSDTESDVESNYDTSSDFVPLNVRKLNIKRKYNYSDSSLNDEYNHRTKRLERNVSNGESFYNETWDKLPNINASEVFIPNTIHEALKSKYREFWILAINEELENYDIYKTTKINLNQIDKNRKLIRLKWIFSFKTNENNNVKKFKARLVAKGYTQKKYVDYFTTYSPTLAYESLRYLIAYAARHSYDCYQLDIKGAYLNSKIDTNIYTEIPTLHPDYEEGYCWKLNKALYGLKQDGKLWYEEINNFLVKKLGFTRTYADTNIYYKIIDNNNLIIIGLYVDDMVIIGNLDNIQDTIKKIKDLYTVSKIDEINYILGIRITKTTEGEYTMDQSKYIQNKLDEYNITGEKDNPYSEISDNEKNNIEIDPIKYRSAIGSLIHLA